MSRFQVRPHSRSRRIVKPNFSPPLGVHLGYLAIYLLGLATGLYTFPPSPTFFRTLTTRLPRSAPSELIRKLDAKRDKVLGRRSSSDDPPSRRGEKGGQGGASSAVARRNAGQRKKAEWLVSAAVWWWILYGIATFGVGARVSRRLVSLREVLARGPVKSRP